MAAAARPCACAVAEARAGLAVGGLRWLRVFWEIVLTLSFSVRRVGCL